MPELTLHDYQIVARDFLRGRDRAALFLDMGLGKTAASLSALEPRHLPVLVVAPKRVAENVWHAETALWRPDLTVAVAMGEPAARAKILASDADIIVLGRDNLKDVAKVRREIPFRTLILDELSGYKTRASVRWKAARKIAATVDSVWGLTGTPTPNGYMNLWAQIALLDNGERLGRNITAYRNRYFYAAGQLPNGVVIDWKLHEGADARIREKVEDICLAMKTDGRIDLPPTSLNKVAVELPPEVRKIYRSMNNDMVVGYKDTVGSEIYTASQAAALSNRLQQITAGFMYSDDRDIGMGRTVRLHNEKPKALREIVEETGSPVLVAYRYQEELAFIQEELGDLVHTADEPDLQARWNAGEFPVLAAHPASIGHGLNLQHGGHTIVWTTLDWDLELWDQFNKRLSRQGQAQPVVIHVILANKTTDHACLRTLHEKEEVQDFFMDYLESPV